MKKILALCGWRIACRVLLAVMLPPAAATFAQTGTPVPQCPRASADAPSEMRVIRLKYVAQQNDANEVLVALRNLLCPSSKLFLVTNQNVIVISAPTDQQALAEKVVSELDQPRKLYRLAFTLYDVDGGKRTILQHTAIAVLNGQRATLKQGSKVPVMTAPIRPEDGDSGPRVSYLDVGFNIDVTPSNIEGGLTLKCKVEQSSIAPEKSGIGLQDPIVNQSVLEAVEQVTFRKAAILGSIELPGSSHHVEIEVTAEPLP